MSLTMRFSVSAIPLAAAMLAAAVPAAAQDREVPYWATLREDEVNMRTGPSGNYPIEWVYRRQGLPMKVVRLNQGWRLVEDPDGARGWIAARLLNPARGAIVIGDDPVEIREAPSGEAPVRWRAEPGVVGKLGDCDNGWCRFDVTGRNGWVREDRLWGAGQP
ncbi:SH3 domain-containing protein [Croceibacterium xixiisoli]